MITSDSTCRARSSQAWTSEVQDNFNANHLKTKPGFRRALIGTWKRFYGQPDLRKAGLKYTRGLEWEKKYDKHGHTPVQFTQRIETLYSVLKQMDEDPGVTPMPTARQKKEDLVEAFPKDYQDYYDLHQGDYTQSMAQIGQIMEDHFNRENESDSDSDSSSSDDESESDSSTSASSESSDEDKKKRKRKRAKTRRKKTSKKAKHSKKSNYKRKKKTHNKRTPDKQGQGNRFSRPNVTDTCPIHGGHTWGECRLNPRSQNYDPPKPYNRGNNDQQQQQQGQQGNYRGRNSNQNNQGQQYFIGDSDEQAPPTQAPMVPSGTRGIIRVPTQGNPYQSSYATWGTLPRK